MAESSSSPAISRKRRKIIIGSESQARVSADTAHTRWRTEAEQRIYSSKLVHTLRRNDSSSASGRAVRDEPAFYAKGKTRWSRAILTRRTERHKKVPKPCSTGSRLKKPAVKPKLRPLQSKVRALSRLVPGCRKALLPNLLEETASQSVSFPVRAPEWRLTRRRRRRPRRSLILES